MLGVVSEVTELELEDGSDAGPMPEEQNSFLITDGLEAELLEAAGDLRSKNTSTCLASLSHGGGLQHQCYREHPEHPCFGKKIL